MRVLDLGDRGLAGGVEGGGGDDQDGRVDEQRPHQRHRRIDGGEADRRALLGRARAYPPGLHDGRMQVQIVRHHGGTQDTDRDVEHGRLGDDRPRSARSPRRRPAASGRDQTISSRKQAAMVAIRATTNASISRKPRFCKNRISMTSRAVSSTPSSSRRPEQELQGDRRADHLGEVGPR